MTFTLSERRVLSARSIMNNSVFKRCLSAVLRTECGRKGWEQGGQLEVGAVQSTQTMVAAYNEFGIVRGCEKSSNSGYALKRFC